jgi:hypothetical protein
MPYLTTDQLNECVAEADRQSGEYRHTPWAVLLAQAIERRTKPESPPEPTPLIEAMQASGLDEFFRGASIQALAALQKFAAICRAQPIQPNGVTAEHLGTLCDLLVCLQSWDGSVRVLGNVRAEDAANAVSAVLGGMNVRKVSQP